MKSLEDLVCCSNRVNELVRSGSMTSLAMNFNSYHSHSSKEASRAAPNIALIEVRDIVEAIDFINTIKTPFLNHGESTTRTFFGWLPEKSNCFI